MRICTFCEEDIEEVNAWYKKRKLLEISVDSFPKLGFIVHGIAAVFVYMTDSNIAMIEGLITNPDSSYLARGRAIKSLVNTAYTAARNLRSRVVVLIENDGVQRLALSLGYKSIGKYELLMRG